MLIRPIGILGGTFDPVHLGHLRAAEVARDRLGLSGVLFVPNRTPPHKPGQAVTAPADRMAMLELAIAGHPEYAITDLELHRTGPSYSYDTIQTLRHEHPDWQLYFILGADGFVDLRTWHRWDELLRLCCFAIVSRPGYDRRLVEEMLADLGPDLAEQVVYLEAPGVDVASSRIRELVGRGEPLTGLVLESVAAYIYQHGLYRLRSE